jgi:hypothetical protein
MVPEGIALQIHFLSMKELLIEMLMQLAQVPMESTWEVMSGGSRHQRRV